MNGADRLGQGRAFGVPEAGRATFPESMKTWRMSFKAGNQGKRMWPDCLRLGVAAITYNPLATTDLSQFPHGEPRELWGQLATSQKVSLRRLAYEMRPGDAIYVKDGPKIIDRGIVTGPYQFDAHGPIDPEGVPWSHQVPVFWSREFDEVNVLLGSEQYTVLELSGADVARLESVSGSRTDDAQRAPIAPGHHSARLLEEAYYRETPARLKAIARLHNKLSNDFCGWLQSVHGVAAIQEWQRVDVRFRYGDRTVIAELKVCFGPGPTRSIREALGQLLEYNHYPAREPSGTWLIVLDEEPSPEDRPYIDTLRYARALPICLGWRARREFAFHPRWP